MARPCIWIRWISDSSGLRVGKNENILPQKPTARPRKPAKGLAPDDGQAAPWDIPTAGL